MTTDATTTGSDERVTLELHVLRIAAVAAAAGAMAGFLVGGIGGRLAMRLLAAASPSLRGLTTDDGAEVGLISTDGTFFLLSFTTLLGAVAGVVYFAVRPVLPPATRARAALFAALTGAVGGALVLHDSTSFDFGLLEPRWFAVAAFVALPAAAGALTAVLTERWTRLPTGSRLAAALLVAGVLALLLSFVVSVPVTVLGVVIAQVPALRRIASSRPVAVAGLTILALLVAWGLYGIAADVVSIVTDQPSTAPLSP